MASYTLKPDAHAHLGQVLEAAAHDSDTHPMVHVRIPGTSHLTAIPRDLLDRTPETENHIPPQPEGDFFVIDTGEGAILPHYVVQRALGGWHYAGGNKGGSTRTWEELCKRHRIGQPGGATITRLVRETTPDSTTEPTTQDGDNQ